MDRCFNLEPQKTDEMDRSASKLRQFGDDWEKTFQGIQQLPTR